MTALAEALARFSVRLEFTDLPPEVVRKAKGLILDSLGCTLGAWALPPGRVVLETAQTMGGPGPFGVAGSGVRVPLPWCIYANSDGANILDFDDVHPRVGHPGATIVPPALALLQAYPCTGKELITCVVASYEIGMRIAEAIAPSAERAEQIIGFATWQVFSSASVAARFLGLDVAQTAHALAVAGSRAVVPYVRKSGRHERPYAWVKNNYGWTAMAGYLSAWQVRAGFRGNPTILDGPRGFWLMAGSDRCEPAKFTEGLGRSYRVLEVGLKRYPACRHMHAALDALRAILVEHGIGADDVSEIIVVGSPALAEDFIVPEPVDIIDAQFSLSYMMAMLLLGREPGYAWLQSANLCDPEVVRAARKVSATVDRPASLQANADWPTRVKVRAADGRVWQMSVAKPRGHPDNPLDHAESSKKFLHLAEPVVGRAHADELLNRLSDLENEEDLDWIDRANSPCLMPSQQSPDE